MLFLNALSITSHVTNWLITSRRPRILHIFDSACNLVNERREVLSVVTPQIGNGPFNLVLDDDICFFDFLDIESPLILSSGQLALGDLTVSSADAELWDPRPGWELLHSKKDHLSRQISQLPLLKDQLVDLALSFATDRNLQPLLSNFTSALASARRSAAKTASTRLAGLGVGLTPSGDDFIVGALYAAWILHPPEVAGGLAQAVAQAAAPQTTSLSAAWLKAASRGQAGVVWHNFFEALVSNAPLQIQETMKTILAVGETSGADALAGFTGVFVSGRDKVDFSHG